MKSIIVFHLIIVMLQSRILSLFRKNINLLYYINRCLNSIFSCKFDSRLVLNILFLYFRAAITGILRSAKTYAKRKTFLLQDLITLSGK